MSRAIALVTVVLGACSVGPAEVTVGDQTTQVAPSEMAGDIFQFGNAVCFVMFLTVVLVFMAISALLRYLAMERRAAATQRTSTRPMAVGQQGVLTLQFLLPSKLRASIESMLPERGTGSPALAAVARVLKEHRTSWHAVAARGSTLMEEASADSETGRIVSLFDARASRAGGGHDAALLTVAVRAPYDYSGVMPGDMDGFSTVLSNLFEVPTEAPCGYQLGWAPLGYGAYDAVVPGLVSA